MIPAQFVKTSIDKGNSTFDVRHTFNGALVYMVPAPKMNKLANALLHNWSIQGIFTARSALPFDILESGYGLDPRFQAIARADVSAQASHCSFTARPSLAAKRQIPLHLRRWRRAKHQVSCDGIPSGASV